MNSLKRITFSDGSYTLFDQGTMTVEQVHEIMKARGRLITKIEPAIFEAGTPSTLDEAIFNALCVGALREVPERAYHVLRDFLAQGFGTAYMQASENPEALEILENLFRKLTRREK